MFSVIIPNYNQKAYIRTAIQSVLEQTCQDFEIIVVDDGSTDDSQSVIDEIHMHVRYMRQENKGLASARNTGIKAAKGEWVSFLDADDAWLPNYLETIAGMIEKYPQASIFYSRALCMDTNGKPLPQQVGSSNQALKSKEAMYQALLRSNFLIPSTITARRSVLMKAGLFDERLRYCEDIDLWLRIARDQRFVGTDVCTVYYRVHDASLSTKPQKTQQALISVIQKYFGQDDGLHQTWPDDKKRAYGGAYRFQVLTSIQQVNDWDSASKSLRKAIAADPTLTMDIDLFYEIALGNHPKGFRNQANAQELQANYEKTMSLLRGVFSGDDTTVSKHKWLTYSTANYASALLCYNTRQYSQARKYLLRCLAYHPRYFFTRRVLGTILRAFGGRGLYNLINPEHRNS